MILAPIWVDNDNKISIKDSEFSQAADSFVLKLEHLENCSLFSFGVSNISSCEGIVHFSFSVDCVPEIGIYKAELFNTTTDTIYKLFKAEIYPSESCC